mmetsp:Transcript_51537/g.137550  ORF Transcript_51537/g.137550 Transcript_51537/m.137550 type:complete len:421 (-) Transcript_51537:143-1405(-)
MGYYSTGYSSSRGVQELSTLERLLRQLAKEGTPESLDLLEKIVRNVVEHASEEKFRTLRASNAKLAPLFVVDVASDTMLEMGWLRDGELFVLPATVRLDFQHHVVPVLEAKRFQATFNAELKKSASRVVDAEKADLIRKCALDRREHDAQGPSNAMLGLPAERTVERVVGLESTPTREVGPEVETVRSRATDTTDMSHPMGSLAVLTTDGGIPVVGLKTSPHPFVGASAADGLGAGFEQPGSTDVDLKSTAVQASVPNQETTSGAAALRTTLTSSPKGRQPTPERTDTDGGVQTLSVPTPVAGGVTSEMEAEMAEEKHKRTLQELREKQAKHFEEAKRASQKSRGFRGLRCFGVGGGGGSPHQSAPAPQLTPRSRQTSQSGRSQGPRVMTCSQLPPQQQENATGARQTQMQDPLADMGWP